MNTDTGQIREFLPTEEPKPAEQWVKLVPGQVVSFKGLNFRIHRINPAANQVILVGISLKEALESDRA